jgi:four helix bundle protein
MGDFKKLTAFKKAYELSMEIFEVSKKFPKEEIYSLTDQIRRSSRSVSVSIAEGYRKRQYKAHFIAKMSDADMENSETNVWLDFAFDCKYITKEIKNDFQNKSNEIGRLLYHMIQFPDKYQTKEMKIN